MSVHCGVKMSFWWDKWDIA